MARIVEDKPVGGYTVIVDDNFHYQDPDHRYKISGFAAYEEALDKCKSIVDACLAESAEPGRSADEIFGYYQAFGEDPWIVPEGEPFSAWDYAEKNAHRFMR